MMNDGKFSKFLRVGLLSLTLFAAVLPVAAQTNDNANTTRTADNRNDDRRVATRGDRDDDTDWGWLGLLGLAGLLGLMPRKKKEVHVRDTHDARDPRDTGGRR
jgi:MYXO-CTERM domain-containing protein